MAAHEQPELGWSFVGGAPMPSNCIKLYDRQEQINHLREAFGRHWPSSSSIAASTRTNSAAAAESSITTPLINTIFPELILISGASGTGKTVLARKVMQQLVQEKHNRDTCNNGASVGTGGGWCVLGKFDQQLHHQETNDNVWVSPNVVVVAEPYSAFVAALTELAKIWKAQGPHKLEEVFQKLDTAPQAAGGVDDETWMVLRALVPALECVFCAPATHSKQSAQEDAISDPNKIKACTDTTTTKVYEAQRDRLQKTLKTFIQTVFSPTEPLILMLDDLQWADSGSLELLESLACDPVLFDKLVTVGICRSNEVPWHHDFACTLRRLEDEKRTKITNVQVQNLSLQATVELVADLLHQPLGLCTGVAEVIHDKSEGNAFFALQLIKTLYEEGVLIAQARTGTTLKRSGNTTGTGDDYQWLWNDDLWSEYFESGNLSAVDLVFRCLKRLP